METTFKRTRGLCKPCWKKQRRERISQTAFGIAYDRYFHRPPRLKQKYFDCWIQLELKVAGPLFAARERGDISFVFKKSAIKGVKGFEDLMAWMIGEIARFRERASEIEPSTAVEVGNRDALLMRAADLERLIGLWPDFDKEFGRGAA